MWPPFKVIAEETEELTHHSFAGESDKIPKLTLALAGGRYNPPEFFFCNARRTLSRIVLKVCIAYGSSFTQLLVKNFDRVMSSHGVMTSQEVQCEAIFARNSGISVLLRHTCLCIVSAHVVKISDPVRPRSGHQVTSSDLTSEKVSMFVIVTPTDRSH